MLHINFTSYNVRCNQDTINPHTNSNIMMLASDPDDEHPYLYAWVIGIFHVKVQHVGIHSQDHLEKICSFSGSASMLLTHLFLLDLRQSACLVLVFSLEMILWPLGLWTQSTFFVPVIFRVLYVYIGNSVII